MKKFFNFILEIIFPAKCFGCFSYTSKKYFLCDQCLEKVFFSNFFICPICHKKVDLLKNTSCFHKDLYFKKILCPLDYKDETIKNLILKFKYQKFLNTSVFFEQILYKALLPYNHLLNNSDYLIVPVPLYFLKERQRGFNQSVILAEIVSRILNISICHALIRCKNNPPQAQISNQEKRLANAKDIFQINTLKKSFVKNKNIILIDDVFTTGATLNECAKILKENHTKSIVAVCLAK